MDDEDRYTRITLRIPKDLHGSLSAEAARTSKSLNAEILQRLEDSFGDEARAALTLSVAQLQAQAIERQFVTLRYQAALLSALELLRFARSRAREAELQILDKVQEDAYFQLSAMAATLSRDLPFSVPEMKKAMERTLERLSIAIENYMQVEGDQGAITRYQERMAEIAARRAAAAEDRGRGWTDT